MLTHVLTNSPSCIETASVDVKPRVTAAKRERGIERGGERGSQGERGKSGRGIERKRDREEEGVL